MFKPHFHIFLLFCRLCQPGHIAGISRFFQRDFLAEFEGSDAKKQARIYLTTFGIDYDAITKEQFVNLVDVLKLSKHMKSLTNQLGRARPYQPHGDTRALPRAGLSLRHTDTPAAVSRGGRVHYSRFSFLLRIRFVPRK